MSTTTNTYHKRALNIKETAEYVGVSRGVINNWLDACLLPCEELPGIDHDKNCNNKKTRRLRLIRKVELDKFLDRYHGLNQKNEKCVHKKKENVGITLLPRKK